MFHIIIIKISDNTEKMFLKFFFYLKEEIRSSLSYLVSLFFISFFKKCWQKSWVFFFLDSHLNVSWSDSYSIYIYIYCKKIFFLFIWLEGLFFYLCHACILLTISILDMPGTKVHNNLHANFQEKGKFLEKLFYSI